MIKTFQEGIPYAQLGQKGHQKESRREFDTTLEFTKRLRSAMCESQIRIRLRLQLSGFSLLVQALIVKKIFIFKVNSRCNILRTN